MPPSLEPSISLADAWTMVLERIEKERGASEVDAWLRDSRLVEFAHGTAIVEVPTQLHQERIQKHLGVVCKVLDAQECRVRLTDAPLDELLFPEGPQGLGGAQRDPMPALPSAPAPAGAGRGGRGPFIASGFGPESAPLHPDYNFDNFVVGSCNRFAHAAALAVSERPAESFNPLFLHGSVGVGKTHLMHAIAHGVRQRKPEARILTLSCEQFTNHFIHALKSGSFDAFREHYRQADVLIVDDVHLLSNKQRTQEEFFHTFNVLHAAGRQIVLSSDAPPQEIPSLQERLVSRFKWGLTAEISKPAYETRVAILQRKAERRGVDLPDSVARFLAEQVQDNVRELEGSLMNLTAQAALDGQPISLRLAQRAIHNGAANGRRPVRMDDVLDAVTSHFGVKLPELQSKRRSQSIVGPRQVAMYLARKMTPLSLEEIGAYFGGRDHSTVIYAVQKVADRMRVDGDYARRIADVERVTRQGLVRGT